MSRIGRRRRVIPVAKFRSKASPSVPDGKRVWVGSNGDSIVVVVDAEAGRAIDTLRGFGIPYRLAVSRDGATAIVTDPARGEVRIFDAVSRRQRLLITIPARRSRRDRGSSGFAVAGRRDDVSRRTLGIRDASGPQPGRHDRPRSGKIAGYAPTGTWSDGIAYSTLESR